MLISGSIVASKSHLVQFEVTSDFCLVLFYVPGSSSLIFQSTLSHSLPPFIPLRLTFFLLKAPVPVAVPACARLRSCYDLLLLKYFNNRALVASVGPSTLVTSRLSPRANPESEAFAYRAPCSV